jgi:hypothetical protein
MEAGADSILYRKPHAHRLWDHQDVAEDDGRVYTQEIHRLQGDFRGQFRRPHHSEKVGSLSYRTVFGEVAAGLAHHPDRRSFHRLAPTGPEEEIAHRISAY